MFQRIANHLCRPAPCWVGAALLLSGGSLSAQPNAAPISPAQFDPSDVYFQGYLSSRAAEELEAKGDYAAAAEKLRKARELFDAVHKNYPAWKPEMVNGRSSQNAEAETRIFSKAEEQRKKTKAVVAELEGGQKTPGREAELEEKPEPNVLQVDPLVTRRLKEAESEVKRLKDLTAQNQAARNDPEASRNESRVADMARQRDLAQAQLRAAETNLQALRSRLGTSPMDGEVKSLNQRIASLEQEREAMAMALTQSRSAHTEALSRNAVLEADIKVMQQKYADLTRDLKAERGVANSVVAGQRTQLEALGKELSQKDAELGKANERIGELIKELGESKDAFAQIRSERDSLLLERDQMSALLKLNEDGRIQDLIQQNMGLAKNLREANEKVERLNADTNSSKDDTTDALRDLAIAKSQINKLHQEKRDQDQRLITLEARLKSEQSALASGQASSNPEEITTLRDIIQRQLRVQERRRQARDLLLTAVKDMGNKDERLSQALNLFESQEIQLSPDEQRLIADQNVDGSFVSPFAQDRSIVGRNTAELNRDISVLERTAEKSYAAGRLLPTRELFQMIMEQNPGHVATICKLGIVDLKLKDPAAALDKFRRAVELDANNPYCNRMLGVSQMTMGDLSAAQQSVKRATELAPSDATNQLLLGTISERLENLKEAESCYKAAISADPVSSFPYYNLARLCSRTDRLEKARDYYNLALERGAEPDPALEHLLAQQ